MSHAHEAHRSMKVRNLETATSMTSTEGGSSSLPVVAEKCREAATVSKKNVADIKVVVGVPQRVGDIEEAVPMNHTIANAPSLESEACSGNPATAALSADVSAREEAEGVQFAARDTRVVFYLKLLVLAVLVASALCVALGVYFYTSNAETSAFETSFVDDANKVLDSLGSSMDLTLGAVESFVVSLVSFAEYSNSTWPFVTLPDFAVRSSKILSLCNAVYFNVYLQVTSDQRIEWERYSTENDAWVDDGIDIQSRDDTYDGPIIRNFTTLPYIHDNTEDPSYADNNTGPYLVTWQNAPVIPRYPPYNWDLMSSVDQRSMLELIDSHNLVISEAYMLPDPNDAAAVEENEYYIDWFRGFVEPDEDPSEPVSDWYYPILDTGVDQVRIASPKNETFAGILAMSIFWRDMMKNILPSDSDGIVVVFENECNPTFTYQINGPEVVYLGRGDMHNPNYDHLQISSKLLDLNPHSTRESSYTGIPVDDNFCPFILHLYPSDTMKAQYATRNPVIFTVSAVLIFAFTSCVFLIYDRLVERRQRKVMYTALQSRANVSVLEEKVKERTRSLEGTNRRLEEANRRVTLAAAAQLQHFACMSHEIRTPLNCIIGLSSLFEETELTPMQRESMRMIVTSGDLLLTVVNDVLDYSKLESGNVDIEIRRINLQETLDAVVHSIETKGESMNVSLSTKYDAAIKEYIHTDSRRLQQILYNLLGNALKFSREGGVVELSVLLCSRSSIPIRQDSYSHGMTDAESSCSQPKLDGYVLRFIVKDYGKGIARENFPKIFQPFSQASVDTERLYGGTGLGLAITAKLVKALGGTISVDSEEGQWTEFSVNIPFDEDPVDVLGISAGLSNTTVFLVGNEEEKVNQVADTLRQFNVDFATFSDMQQLAAEHSSHGEFSHDRTYVCLVHEDLFDKETFERVFDSVKKVLLTYGPKYGAGESLGHYRSLVQILPSVLMRSMAAHVKESEEAKQKELARRQSKAAANTLLYREWRILIAEDNLVNQKVLSRILKRLGVENVEIVDNGKKAVDREAAEAFDLVLMDMQMPVMDGIEACRHIVGRQGGHAKAKIVFVTAHVQDSFESDCLTAGAVCFLPKPCSVRAVEDCLRKVADEHFFR